MRSMMNKLYHISSEPKCRCDKKFCSSLLIVLERLLRYYHLKLVRLELLKQEMITHFKSNWLISIEVSMDLKITM